MSSRANLKFTAIAKLLHPLQLQCTVSIKLADARGILVDSSVINVKSIRNFCSNNVHPHFTYYSRTISIYCLKMSDWEDEQPLNTNAPAQNNNMVHNVKKYAPKADDWDASEHRQNSSRANYASNNKDDHGDRSFELDQRHVGIVIGRGGSNIRDVEQRFNVRMKIGK